MKNLDRKEFTVRGYWEENVAKRLNDLGLLWIKNQRIKYVDDKGIRRTYNPDFYIPSLKRYVEVKGYYSDKDKRKMKFVLT